ncbi:MICOS complex subunit MIC10-like [Globicephala melas]|uniref:MICOS complex subunit MIC10-like n=1 Tax=Globicephala melas TaxID=9731 RepID=UPI00293D5D11|nr:MICOS complex subunit MIC10-like [Globicephala melas]
MPQKKDNVIFYRALRSGKLELRVGNTSDSELSRKWDRCLPDAVGKIGRMWPLAFGSGMGLGKACSNCQHDFQVPYLLHGKYVKEQQQ